MSYLIADPRVVGSAVTDLSEVRSAIVAAQKAARGAAVVMAAAADEVSIATADMFGYRVVSAQAATSAGPYMSAEARSQAIAMLQTRSLAVSPRSSPRRSRSSTTTDLHSRGTDHESV